MALLNGFTEMETLYITGAGVSAASGIPTFRGQDGFWTIGSRHYTPQEMATRAMYRNDPMQLRRFGTLSGYTPTPLVAG